jgi:3-demethoxyubiquinol 3-hydroxylase
VLQCSLRSGGERQAPARPPAAEPRPYGTLLLMDIDTGSRILKVNHAGEHGAVNIYGGQIVAARLTAPAMLPQLFAFRLHEMTHRATFAAELAQRGHARCRSYWLCGVGGWLLGFLTGLCGSKMIAATTIAVERVVLRHLEHQLTVLEGKDDAAVTAILSIVSEEREHHDEAVSRMGVPDWCSKTLEAVVAASTEMVIWVGMRA